MKKILALLLALFPAVASAQIVGTLPFQLQNGTTADATQVMADFNKILNDVNANAAKNGVNTDITALTALTTPITPAQGGTSVYFASTSGGSANAQTVASPTPTGFTLAVGKRVTFIAGFTNTGAMTLNVNSSGATNVYKPTPSGPVALVGGEVIAGNYIEAVFDGTQFQLYTDASVDGGYGAVTVLASATTTDLGTIPSHNVSISGTTTITSFGSSASTVYPQYRIVFSGALLLTHSSALQLPGSGNITTAAGDVAFATYLGSGNWRVSPYQKVNGTAVVNPTPMAGAQGLLITNNSGTPNTNIDITADQAVMINPTGNVPIYASAISVTINTTTTGANGLDTGSRANSTWYNLFLISNGSATAGLASTSATAPTLPSGYVYYVRVGAMRTDGSANFYRSRQLGSRVQYVLTSGTNTSTLPIISSGAGAVGTYSATAPTWSAQSVSNFVPPTATRINLAFSTNRRNAGAGSNLQIAPNNSYGGYATSTDAIPFFDNGASGAWGGSLEMLLESTNIYIAYNQNTTVSASGWTDKVNAN